MRSRARFGLTLARAHGLEGRLVAKGVLARLDDEGKTGVDVVGRLLDLLLSSGGHCEGARGSVGQDLIVVEHCVVCWSGSRVEHRAQARRGDLGA